MIDSREILEMSAATGLRPDVIEKDYVLGWLLAGIYNHSAIKDTWAFKGGTCLKKCYFETYRFSEDLDFTLEDEGHIDDDFLKSTFQEIADWVYEQTGIEIPKSGLSFDIFTNPRGTISCQGKVAYRGPISPSSKSIPKIKLDLTADERLVLIPALQPVYHPYSDEPADGIKARCYVYEEVFGEKFRALAERTRPRDLYDVVNLFRNSVIKPSAAVILDVLRQKCDFKGISVPTLASLEPHKAGLEGSWENMLGHQLASLPPVDSYWGELPAIFEWIEKGQEPVIPTAFPLKPGETILRERSGRGLTVRQGSQFIEVIRFAAANRLCVELDYMDEKGRRSLRLIEPYSLRKTQDGNIILHSVRVEDGQPRGYRADRIQGARVTNQSFIPRYEIELTPAGPVVLAPTSVGSRIAAPRVRSAVRTRTPKSSYQRQYVFQCSHCQKKFTHTSNDPSLRKHKDKNGYPCSSRRGYLTEVR